MPAFAGWVPTQLLVQTKKAGALPVTNGIAQETRVVPRLVFLQRLEVPRYGDTAHLRAGVRSLIPTQAKGSHLESLGGSRCPNKSQGRAVKYTSGEV